MDHIQEGSPVEGNSSRRHGSRHIHSQTLTQDGRLCTNVRAVRHHRSQRDTEPLYAVQRECRSAHFDLGL